jgi:D-erythrulose 1-phosphate 3-epimerase
MNPIGINLSFAVKRWVEPEAWTAQVLSFGLNLAQFSFDLIDPLWSASLRSSLVRDHRSAAKTHEIEIHSAFVGLACYTYNNLLHPRLEGREAAKAWWRGAMEIAVELGTTKVGGPLGGMSVQDASNPSTSLERLEVLNSDLHGLLEYAKELGLTEFLIEPVPLKREFPWTVFQARDLVRLHSTPELPVTLCVDIGHALYKPLYGENAKLEDWLALNEAVGLLHLQQTDAQSDSHWALGDPRGVIKLEALKQSLTSSGHKNLPVMLEIFFAFEEADDLVLEATQDSVSRMRQTWQG